MTKLQRLSIASIIVLLATFAGVAAAHEPAGDRASADQTLKVHKTPTDSRLTCDVAFDQTISKLNGPIDGFIAASIANEFVHQWPQDIRSAEVLHKAITKLNSAWQLRVAVIVFMGLISALTAIISLRHSARSCAWLKLGMLLGLIGVVTCFILMTTFPHFPGARKIDSIASRLIRPSSILAVIRIFAQNLGSLVCTYRFAVVVLLGTTTSALLVITRKHSTATILTSMPIASRVILGFSLVVSACFAEEACLISHQRTEFMRRVVQEYPNSSRSRLAQGQIRKRERIGKPFELDFTDEISGRSISMKDLRGTVVVVNFWASWCGPCVAEIPEMKRLYAKYHAQGVEFIGVSQDLPETEGGRINLLTFLEKEKIPWPQFYQGHDHSAFATGSAEPGFSESWGVDEIPTTFLIDANGNLYSTQAHRQLDAMIQGCLTNGG